jgi:hypothetical protein
MEAQHLARCQMLDAAFLGQRCVRRLGAKLDDKGSIGWQRGWQLKHSQIPRMVYRYVVSSYFHLWKKIQEATCSGALPQRSTLLPPYLYGFKYRSNGGAKGISITVSTTAPHYSITIPLAPVRSMVSMVGYSLSWRRFLQVYSGNSYKSIVDVPVSL